MVFEAPRVALGFDLVRHEGPFVGRCPATPGKSGVGKSEMSGNFGIFALVVTKGCGTRFGFPPAKIIAVMRHNFFTLVPLQAQRESRGIDLSRCATS